MFKQGAFVNVLTGSSQEWRDALRRVEKLPHLDHVELWIEHIPTGSELIEFREIFRGIRLIIHGPFIHTSLVSHLQEVVALTERRFDDAVEFASNVNASVVTFHAGSYPIFESKQDALDKLAKRFERFSELSSPIATLENMPVKGHGTVHEPIGSVSDFEDLVHLLPQLRFTLDVGHCLQNGDDFDLFIRKYSSRIQNIHLHDGIARGNAHLRLGDGSLNLSQLLETLHNIHFDRYVSLETISPEDTLSSWRILRESEASNRLLDEDGTPSLGQLRPISRGVHL